MILLSISSMRSLWRYSSSVMWMYVFPQTLDFHKKDVPDHNKFTRIRVRWDLFRCAESSVRTLKLFPCNDTNDAAIFLCCDKNKLCLCKTCIRLGSSEYVIWWRSSTNKEVWADVLHLILPRTTIKTYRQIKLHTADCMHFLNLLFRPQQPQMQ